MKRIANQSLVLAFLLLAGVNGSFGQQAPTIVVLGSSTAEGVGPEHADSTWVNRYKAYVARTRPGAQVINLAKGGYTTFELLPTGTSTPEDRRQVDTLRNITRALTFRPDALIINLPSNDVTSGYPVAEQLRNYTVILNVAEKHGIPVWLSTTQPRNLPDDGRRLQMAVRDSLRTRYGDRVLDFWTDLATEDGNIVPAYDSGDGIHLNDRAHGVLFGRVVAAGILEKIAEP